MIGRLALILPLLVGVGCITFVGGFVWKKQTAIIAMVFADDDARILGANTSLEITLNTNPPLIPGRTRRHDYQLFTQNRKGTNRRELGQRREGILGTAYLMTRAGYALVDETTGSHKRFVQVQLDDNSTRVVHEVPWYHRSLPFIRMIPSPDGKVLARCQLTQRSLPKEAGQVIPRKIAEVEVAFLDAVSLEILQRTTTILFAESASALAVKWRPDNTLLLTCFVEREARVVTLKGEARPIICPTWIGGATTTSGQWDRQGRSLLGLDPDRILNLGEPTPEYAFGAN